MCTPFCLTPQSLLPNFYYTFAWQDYQQPGWAQTIDSPVQIKMTNLVWGFRATLYIKSALTLSQSWFIAVTTWYVSSSALNDMDYGFLVI